jgi:single-stranded-DNA-specific exonuclease
MGHADAALELLMTEDEARAEEVARELDLLNRDRREAETRILFAAEAACAEQASAGALVVAGEGWHPGVVGIVASRLVERHGRPCVVVAMGEDGGRGSGRSIPAYDLHAGLAACARHLRRFGGHRAAAGLEIDPEQVGDFRRALAAHAAAVLSPSDLVPVERVDAVVPGGALTLELAEELESLRPYGPGNPQPTLLVPAARVEDVNAMGSERQHARFVLATGGARSRGVAFGSPPRALAPANGHPYDLAVRLERNRWNGAVEPRVLLRALCPTRPGGLRVLGEEGSFWSRLERELGAEPDLPPAVPVAAEVRDRRREGFAGVVGDLLTSGESVLVAVADVPRRRASLETLVAGLAPGGLAVASWNALARDAALAWGFEHLVALDPPPTGAPVAGAPGRGPVLHLAWGDAEAEFALAVWRDELDLRPALAGVYRALRGLSAGEPEPLEGALRGGGRYPRSPECAARLVRVLEELGLIAYARLEEGGPSCRVPAATRTELERSAAYRAYRARLAAIERALAPELPGTPQPTVAAR